MDRVGTVQELRRYPVKSMLGERVESTVVSERGLAGDRAYVLIDAETGKVVSAKRPRLWGKMFELSAAFESDPGPTPPFPAVRIGLPDGAMTSSSDPEAGRILSDLLGRKVSLVSSVDDLVTFEEVWIDEKAGSTPYGVVVGTEGSEPLIEAPASIAAPPGTFFDFSAIHLVTTGTLARLAQAYPAGRFDVRRFRPNLVIRVPQEDFVENDWLERTLLVGDGVRLEIIGPTPRCVMTTLPQADLPKDPGILRTVAAENTRPWGPFGGQPSVGMYAEVVAGGTVRNGAPVSLE